MQGERVTTGSYPPSDPCLNLGTSVDGTVYNSGINNYFNDIYPPMDYMPNPVLSSWNPGGCTGEVGGIIAGAKPRWRRRSRYRQRLYRRRLPDCGRYGKYHLAFQGGFDDRLPGR